MTRRTIGSDRRDHRIPLVLILACYFIYRAKYKLNETTYANILRDLEARAAAGKEAK